ncbi:putative integrase [Variovorax paradoxus B4]|uniref:Putative integrase n=1 Tax=Variovorax paradoxus B4 TaxID=1246301 RepID=T1XD00_VARPD|nr:site-specific integrase [Variovorax paradoxus]AGU50366.1 putative integrase [Variovorax paradoxus B4]
MPRTAKELSVKAVAARKEPGLHAVGGAPGLHLQITESGARSWVARLTVGTRTNAAGKVVQHRRDFGVGSAQVVTLAAAREAAKALAVKVREGVDPVAEKIAARSRAMAQREAAMTVRKAAGAYIKAMQSKWKDKKAVERRESWLETYAYPHIGDILVADIELAHILAVLKPIWETKTETAEKLLTVLRGTIGWATVHGYRQGKENPARFKDFLDKVLPSPTKVKTVRHHPALPFAQMPTFMRDLRARNNSSARALAVVSLTALRASEVTEAKWSEIDLDAGLWVVPASRMKMEVEHRVPLSRQCVAIFREQLAEAPGEWVFPGTKPGKPLSSAALLEMLKGMPYVDAKGERITTHGLRSTFRDYVAEKTDYPREVVEMALAHQIESEVEAAYRRGDLFQKRKKLMAEWAVFCAKPAR